MTQQTRSAQTVRHLRWTKAAYHRLIEHGWLDSVRTELIGGEIMEKPVAGSRHCRALHKTLKRLEAIFPEANFWVRGQMPLDLSLDSEPEPDVAVVDARFLNLDPQPQTASPVVEVSDSTLHFDQTRKMSLYAAARIDDYWIVNIPDRRVEISRQPVVDPQAEFGYSYAVRTVHPVGDTVSPLAAPHATIAVADLMP